MSKIMWDPATGEHEVFGPDETPPPHWLDHHPDDTAKGDSTPKAAKDDDPNPSGSGDLSGGLTKAEIADALKAGGVEFDASANKATLTDQLIVALKRVLSGRGVAYAENETAAALLDKVTAPPPENSNE